MRPFDDSLLTPDERRAEVANVFAAAILRLHARAALLDEKAVADAEKPPKSASPGLEVPDETVLSVHNG